MCSLKILNKSQQELVEKEFHRSNTWRLRECTFLLNKVRDKEARWNTCLISLFLFILIAVYSSFPHFCGGAEIIGPNLQTKQQWPDNEQTWVFWQLSWICWGLQIFHASCCGEVLMDAQTPRGSWGRNQTGLLWDSMVIHVPWDVVIRAILNLGCSPFLSGSDAANPFSLVQQSVEVVHTTRPTHLVHTRIQRNSLSWWSSVAEYDQPLLRNSQLSTENRIDVCHQVVRACCVLLKNSVFSVPGPTLKLTDQALCCLSQVCLLRTPMSQVARTHWRPLRKLFQRESYKVNQRRYIFIVFGWKKFLP